MGLRTGSLLSQFLIYRHSLEDKVNYLLDSKQMSGAFQFFMIKARFTFILLLHGYRLMIELK